MPILFGGRTAADYDVPDIYIEEQLPMVAEEPGGVTPKVLAILGVFQKGPLDTVIEVNGEADYRQKCGDFLDVYSGSKAAYTAFKRGVRRLLLVNIRGAGAARASIALMDRAEIPEPTLLIFNKHSSAYGNECTCEVQNGTNAGTFRIILSGPGLAAEIYDNLTDPQHAADEINKHSKEFEAQNAASGEAAPDINPAVLAATKFTGGSDGGAVGQAQYLGTTDPVSLRKTGLELLKTSVIATDLVADVYVSDQVNSALAAAAEEMNAFAYLNAPYGSSVTAAVSLRRTFDTEFAHLVFGRAKSKSRGWLVPCAVYDGIAHVLTAPQDGTSGFTFADIESLDLQLSPADHETLTKNQVVCLGDLITAERNRAFGLKSDYTLSSNAKLRQTFRRRVTSLIENDLYVVLTPYRSKHISNAFLVDVELVLRHYLDGLKGMDDKPESQLIQGYRVSFVPPEEVGSVDEFIEILVIDLYNIADKIRVRLHSATDAA